ncbi:peptidylprolyl isomerase [Sphingomonas sp.]|uniref:peptidylprolyl isomerase n=1 Tax=Sphingomonas sp. TaxID=28214 RepID=UPI001EBCDF20|nr:peptidylprolyl isomerase [Sphingomonas sp.]MBX3593389.1 peptidylprolyl isomerase [Sphingomonas sp.]
MVPLLLALAFAPQAQPVAPAPAPSSTAAPPKPSDPLPTDWKPIPADELLVMTLTDRRRIVIRLAPRYAPAHVANIRALARAHWWDGETIYRVHDNYVVQWGDASEKKPLPPGVVAQPPAEYDWARYDAVTRLARRDPYSIRAGHSADGWPLATNGKVAWMPHCYGMVGVARDLAPSTGSGGDLYAVIGHGPRHLDRNIAIVGRVIDGIEHLSSLPRGTGGGLGLYEDPARYVPIVSVRLASELPTKARPRFEYRAADNARFAAWVRARENREPPFFTLPAGGADICNVMPPVRRAL